ncbi:MAG: TRAM domain-containing protein, partial [Planctomycetota bacterium]
LGPFLATLALGIVVVLVDNATPNKQLASVFGIYLGIVAGLVGALAIGALLDLVAESWELNSTRIGQAYIGLTKLAIGITLCYLAVSIVLTTKDDLRVVIPYVEFSKQVRGVRPMVLDTSALIDGRIEGLGATGFLDAPLIVPQFVIDELQTLADSSDKLKRARGRRGLGMVSTLQGDPVVDVTIDTSDDVVGRSVDHKLLQLAAQQHLRILTTDYNLNKVAQIQGVQVLNLNDLSNAIRSQAIPGETIPVEVVKTGEGEGQGVGYLPDGTMVVIESAADAVGETLNVTVTNSLQTSAGRMIFARRADRADTAGDRMAQAATGQPRTPRQPRAISESASSRRNPRRG